MYFTNPEKNLKLTDTFADGEPATFLERTAAAYQAGLARDRLNSAEFNLSDTIAQRNKAIKDATGVELFNPMNMGGSTGAETGAVDTRDWFADYEAERKKIAEKHPDKAHIIQADKPIRIEDRDRYTATVKKEEDAQSNYGGPTGTGAIADFAGGMGAVIRDPAQLPAFAIGPNGPVRQTIRSILTMGVKQAAANAATQAAVEPIVQNFRKRMGDTYGIAESASNVAMAAAFGFGADVIGRSVYRSVQGSLGRKAILDADGAVKGYESAEASIARATRQADSQARAEQLKALQDDGTVQRAMDGDPEAIAKVDPILGLSEDPAVRGASQVQEFVELEPGDFDDIAKSRTFNQALRAAIDADEPPPVIKMERASNRPSLSDDMEIPKGTEGNQHFRTIDIEGKPVHFQNLDPKKITTDAESMQFKSGGNQFGVTGALGINTTFDPAAAGKVIVFERADGVTIIVDGHQRLSIAKDGDQFQGFVFREKDGWSAADVRAEAALKNIHEGRANLLDTVRAMREHGAQMEGRIAVDTDFMRQAVGMSRLSDAAFVRLEAGTIEPHMAALVGELVPDATKHDGVMQALLRANPPDEASARKVIGREIREPVTVEGQTALLGAQDVPDDLIAPRSEVLGDVVAVMRQGTPEQMAASLVIERLSDRPGYVSNLLTDAARAIHTGQPKTRVVDAFMRQIEVTAKDGGVEARIAEPPRVDRFADPAQADSPVLLAALSDVSTGRSMRADLDALGYYSKALEVAKSLKQAKGTPEQMLAQLKSAGVKQAELDAVNLAAFLDGKKSITRDDLVKHLTDNRVGVREVIGQPWQIPSRIGDKDAYIKRMEATGIPDAKWKNYSLDPSNPSYRETVLHLPPNGKAGLSVADHPSGSGFALQRADGTFYENGPGRVARWGERQFAENAMNDPAGPYDTVNFRSGHFSEPNIIGHMMTSLNKHEGKPVYTLDQIQSDWGQKLRDGGVRDTAKIADLEARIKEMQNKWVADKELQSVDADARALAAEAYPDNWLPANARLRLPERKSGNPWAALQSLADDSSKPIEMREKASDLRSQRHSLNSMYEPTIAMLRAELRTAEAATPGNPLVNTTDQWTTTTLRRALRQAAEADAEFIAIPSGDTVLSYNPGDAAGMKGFYGALPNREAASQTYQNGVEGIVPKNLRKLLEKLDKESAKPALIDKLETPAGMKGSGFTLFPLTDKVKKTVMEEGQPLFAKQDAPQAVDQKALQDFSDNLESVLREAQQPSPPRLVSDAKDAKAHTEELRETMAQEIKEAVDPATAEAVRHSTIRAFHGTGNSFDTFRIPRDAFGLHFGTSEQASKRLSDLNEKYREEGTHNPGGFLDGARIIPVDLDFKRSLTLPDLGAWSARTVAKAVSAADVKLAGLFDEVVAMQKRAISERRSKSAVDRDALDLIRTKLIAAGYDSVVYENTIEGAGLSYVALRNGTVRNWQTGDVMFSVIDPSEPLLYTPEANAIQAEIRKEIDRTLQMLPPDVRIRVEDELVFNLNGGSDARIAGLWDGYDRLVYVALSGNDPVRAVRHEVIHALKQSGLLTADEFKQLYAFSETLKLRGAYKIDERYRDLYTKAYGERGGDYVENLLREETIAEMFADYSLNGRRFGDVAGGGLVDRLIDRIVSFMKLLRDNLGFIGFRNVNDIFQAIESGEVASRPSSRNPTGGRNPDVIARQIGEAVDGDRLASFAGERAATADLTALSTAKQMEVEGKPREDIWSETGWFKGVDGKWRFEISDDKAYFDENAAKDLKDFAADDGKAFDYMKDTLPFGGVVGHGGLYGAYPALSDLKTHFIPNSKFGSIKASFSDKDGGRIAFNDALDAGDGRSYGIHEAQHALQSIEGFARGGRHDKWPKELLEAERSRIAAEQSARPKRDDWTVDSSIAPADMTDVDLGRSLYRRLAGEAEARLVQKRMNMTPEERRARPPWLDFDVPESDQIVRMTVDGQQMSMARPSDMINAALEALPDETATAIRNVLKQANIDEAQIGSMVDSLMPMIRSGDQAAVAERVQAMAKEAAPQMMPPQSEFGRALADVQADKEMLDVIGACRA